MAGALARHLRASLRVRHARRVACYLSNDGEMRLGPVMDFLRANGRQVLLPALHGDGLWFLPYDHDTRLAPNRFGIPEPAVTGSARCRARDLDLVLMPLVAFDTTGNRLGMGGWASTIVLFPTCGTGSSGPNPCSSALPTSSSAWNPCPSRPWDVPLHGVATEQRLYRFDA